MTMTSESTWYLVVNLPPACLCVNRDGALFSMKRIHIYLQRLYTLLIPNRAVKIQVSVENASIQWQPHATSQSFVKGNQKKNISA